MTDSVSLPEADPRLDLVEDRSILVADDDHFGHAEFAAQAAATIRAIATPSNIAVYAPWGSGKTSLANLLRTYVSDETCGFAYFDAFKYAEAPLRREFIRRIARELKVDDPRFDRGLYDEETTSDFKLKKASIKSLSRAVGAVAAGAVLVTCLVAVVIAQASGDAFWPEWSSTVKRLLPTFFASSIVLGPLVAVIQAQFGVTRKRYAPQSDEEFESLFRDVIGAALAKKTSRGWKRVVIFIDELDRCAADEVASTLETLRTFLEVQPCVFVVAADRAVLESAVATKARQETPINAQNPYYSLGSSYLDKIFQYQWQLPPMRPSSLTRFAQALVRDRTAGLWSEVDVGEVVSVLVPLHVQSPRRVKELLNAYAMSYRIAERRVADGHLEGDLRPRAAELAKLVSLQLEFPMFASDLPNEPRLTEFVLALALDAAAERPPDVSREIWQRAGAYAAGQLATDVVIASEDSRQSRVSVDDEDASGEGSPEAQVIEAQGHLLVRYLRKTRRIPGPRSDLIFLESAGSPFGLADALAVRLQEAATEGRVDDVVAAIDPLEADQQLASLRLLATHVREALPGVEGANALNTLFGAIGSVATLDIGGIVDELAHAANTGIQEDGLSIDDVAGAVKLGLATTHLVGADLIARALGHPELLNDAHAAGFIAARANEFDAAHVQRLGEVVAALIVDLDWENDQVSMARLDGPRAQEILAAAEAPMLERIGAADASRKAAAEDSSDDQPTAAGATTTEPEVDVEARGPEIATYLDTLAEVAESAENKSLLEGLLELTLAIDHRDARSVVVNRLPPLGLVSSDSLTRAILTACIRRAPSEKARWLDALDAEVFRCLKGGRELLQRVVVTVAEKDATEDTYVDAVREFAPHASRLATTVDWLPASDLTNAAIAHAGLPAVDSVAMTVWRRRIEVARTLEEQGLLEAAEWRPPFVSSGTELAGAAQPDDDTRTVSAAVLADEIAPLVDRVEPASAQAFFDAISGSNWMSASERCQSLVRVVVANRERGTGGPENLPTAELTSAFEAVEDPAIDQTLSQAVEEWLEGLQPSVDQAATVLALYPGYRLPDAVSRGLAQYSLELTREDRTSLVQHALADFPDAYPDEVFLEAARFSESDLEASVRLVISAYEESTNDDQRRVVVRLWNALRLTDVSHIRTLLDGVLNPLIRQNKSARELALQNLSLLQALSSAEKRSVAELVAANASSEERDAAEKKLVEAGFMKKKSRGWLRPSTTEHLDG